MTVLIGWGFVACLLLQWGFWLGMFSALARYRIPSIQPSSANLPPVSVIICAYNEAENLAQHLPYILRQEYPIFEVLVVDDASEDESQKILIDLTQKYPQLRILPLSYPEGRTFLGKKNALSQGIKYAQYDTLLLTDADCRPNSPHWIRCMADGLRGGKEIVLGYGPYAQRAGLLNGFIRFEAVYTAIQYLSFAIKGMPYMGVGRNVMYQRKLFYQVGGFEQHQHIPSGDDDLFVNAVAHKGNTAIMLHPDSFMYSPAKKTLVEYFRQKSRHVTTGRLYRPLHQALLGALSLSHFGMYVLGGIMLCISTNTVLVLLLLLVTCCMKAIVFAGIAKKLRESDLTYNLLLWDGVYLLYYILLSPALFWGKTTKWK